MLRPCWTAFLVVVFVGQAGAVDLTKIPRHIAKEPSYRSSPRYCLLVFGPSASTRVWLVFDGDTLYVDRNANGDLTEPSERVERANSYSSYALGDIREKVGKAVHRSLGVRKYDGYRCRLWVTTHRSGRQYIGSQEAEKTLFSRFARSAPIVHFDGPLVMAQYSTTRTLPRSTDRSKRDRSLRVAIGTSGLGKGTFAACSCKCRSKFGELKVELRFPLDREGKEFLVQRNDGTTFN